MARARIDGVERRDGVVRLRVTLADNGTLRATWGKTVLGPFTREEIVTQVQRARAKLTATDLVFLAVGVAADQDPTFGATFQAACEGKVVTPSVEIA